MKQGFVPTANFRVLAEAQRQVERRGAAEAGIVIVKGPYGIGKSKIVENWAIDPNVRAIFVRAKETWTQRAMLDELADQLGLDKRGRNSEVQARIIGRLAVEMRTLVFDEADHLIRGTGTNSSPHLLEVIRDITDTCGVPCFLVGMEHFASKVGRHGHIASRVARVVEFSTLPLEDVQTTVAKKCEVKLAPEVVQAIHAQSQGRMRLVLNAIANLEQWAQANGWDAVRAEHIKGKALCVEFKPGK